MSLLKKTLVAASISVLASISAFAAPLTWSFDWAAADAALAAATGTTIVNTRPLSNATSELKFTAESVVRFTDGGVDGVGVISAGDTFIDYIVLRIDQLFVGGGSNGETGSGYQTAREITLTGLLTGTQLTDTSYSINSGGLFNIFYDAGVNFTAASFGNLATFIDGNGVANGALMAEQGTTIPPSGGANDSTHADGNINIFMLLADLIEQGDFEVGVNGLAINNFVLGIADGNNNVCRDSSGVASCFSSAANILSFFGVSSIGGTQFEFHTRTDGSMIKETTVPEPSSLVLLGVGLLGLGAFGRRNRRS